jgi:hypothetical protein
VQRFVRRLATPDPQKVWLPFAMRRASRLIAKHRIDTVILSVPPFSELALAAPLKSRFPGLRVVTDFRDEWLDFTLESVESAGAVEKRDAAVRLEREAVEASDLVLSVTATWTEKIRRRYPDQPAEKFRCLPNGYEDDVRLDFRPRAHRGERLVMTYMGTVYARAVYSPEPFLEALEGLEAEVRDGLELRFIGRVEPEVDHLLRNRGYCVVCYGFLPQGEGMRLLEETDLLLLFARDPSWQPAKLLEYVAIGKPILAVAPPEGEAAGLIRRTGTGVTAAPEDAEGIREIVRKMVRRHRAGKPWEIHPDEAAIASYSRSALAGTLAGWMRKTGPE